MKKDNAPLEVLLIEDNPGDAHLISEMLHDLDLRLNITIAEDGQKAMDILQRKNRYSASPTPDFIILDLNLPRINGFAVLSLVRSIASLRSVPVVVMTGSLNKDDEIKARSMGATDFRIKPSSAEDYDTTCKWLKDNIVLLTKGDRQRTPGTLSAVLDMRLTDSAKPKASQNVDRNTSPSIESDRWCK